MDFSAWSPSHTILVAFIAAGFIGQVIISLYRVGQLEKRMARNEDLAEKRHVELHATLDKRIGEVNQRISTEIGGVKDEIAGVRDEIAGVHQRISSTEIGGVKDEIGSLRSEMNQRFSEVHSEIRDVRTELSKLNQNHIDHLIHHQSEN